MGHNLQEPKMQILRELIELVRPDPNPRTGFDHIARREEDARRPNLLHGHIARRQNIHILHGSFEARKGVKKEFWI